MLFDFPAFIEELRENDEKKETIEEYEKYVLNGEKITGDIKDQKWYKDYLSKFQPVPNYQVPEDLEDDFDWALLFQLIAGSFSSVYRLSYQSVNEDGKATLPDLLITVQNGEQKIEKSVSELWSFQVLRLYEIYIEEQIRYEILLHEGTYEEGKRALCQARRNYLKNYKRIISPKNRIIRKRAKKPIKKDHYKVYYYCSLRSAFEIIKSGKIYASDLSYMNDKEESSFGINITINAISHILERKRLNKDLRQKLQNIISVKDENNILYAKPVYISCFTRKPDDLNQWRSYGDNGYGICIGLDFEKTLNDPLSEGFTMGNVTYLKNEYQKNRFWSNLERTILNEFTVQKQETKTELVEIFNATTPDFRTHISFFKNEEFRDEDEFRVICTNEKQKYQVKFRSGKEYIIPYVDLIIDTIHGESSIFKIIIGPSIRDFTKSKRSFTIFINELNKIKAIERIKKLCFNTIKELESHTNIKKEHIIKIIESTDTKVLQVESSKKDAIQKARDSFDIFFSNISSEKSENLKKFISEQQSHVFDELENIENSCYLKIDEDTIVESKIPYLP